MLDLVPQKVLKLVSSVKSLINPLPNPSHALPIIASNEPNQSLGVCAIRRMRDDPTCDPMVVGGLDHDLDD